MFPSAERLASLLGELRRAPSRDEIDRACLALRLREDGGGGAHLTLDDGAPLFDWTRNLRVVRLDEQVFASLPSAEARARVLRRASEIAERIELRATILYDASRLGRVLLDTPRRLLRRLGAAVPEPGDRFRGAFRHHYFDEEPLLREIAAAGCVVVERRGFWFTLQRAPSLERETPEAFAREVMRVARVVRRIERRRLGESPAHVVDAMRARGQSERARGPIGRARLRRAIGWIDALYPGRPNCYRRTLIELALDADAAREPIVFGLDVGSTGHVSFKGREEGAFDVAFELDAANAEREGRS